LTEERRKEYIKVARGKAEDAKVSVRNIRRHAKETIDKLIKDGEVGEDEGKRAEKELDGFTAKHTGQIASAQAQGSRAARGLAVATGLRFFRLRADGRGAPDRGRRAR